jgi:tetratricopeptide (TPR) repeat protein
LRQRQEPAAREIGISIEFSALRDRGAFQEARDILEAELKQRPNDVQLIEMRQHVAADLGDFQRARQLAMQLVDQRREGAVGVDLNNAAWYTIYLEPNPDAARQAERAVELDGGTSHLNTLAAVYTTLGRWDDAANAMKKHVQLVSDEEDEDLHASFWYVRGRVAEAFGRPELARKLYKRVVRAENGSKDDTYFLARKRLSRIGE